MNPKLSARILVALSVLYAVMIGILAVLDVAQSTMTAFTIVGAMVLGALWTVRGLLTSRARRD